MARSERNRRAKRTGDELQAMIEHLRGGATRAVPCDVCGYLMTPTRQGAHTSCLQGVASES